MSSPLLYCRTNQTSSDVGMIGMITASARRRCTYRRRNGTKRKFFNDFSRARARRHASARARQRRDQVPFHVPDQMRIFDTVNSTDAAVSLIDVRAGLLSPTLRALRNIGFIEAAKNGDITFAVFHILGPSIASLDEIVDTAAYLGDAKYFMVKNFINNTHFFEWDEATYAG